MYNGRFYDNYSAMRSEIKKHDSLMTQNKNFISLRVRKYGFTHASRAEIRIFTPRDIKFRTILVRTNVFLTSVITSLAFGSETFHRTRIVMYYFIYSSRI